MFWTMLGSTIAPFIAGAVIEDPEEGSDGRTIFSSQTQYSDKVAMINLFLYHRGN